MSGSGGPSQFGYGPLRQCSSGCCKASPLLRQCTYLQRGSCRKIQTFWGAIWTHVLVVNPVNVCSLGCKRLRWPWCSSTPCLCLINTFVQRTLSQFTISKPATTVVGLLRLSVPLAESGTHQVSTNEQWTRRLVFKCTHLSKVFDQHPHAVGNQSAQQHCKLPWCCLLSKMFQLHCDNDSRHEGRCEIVQSALQEKQVLSC